MVELTFLGQICVLLDRKNVRLIPLHFFLQRTTNQNFEMTNIKFEIINKVPGMYYSFLK